MDMIHSLSIQDNAINEVYSSEVSDNISTANSVFSLNHNYSKEKYKEEYTSICYSRNSSDNIIHSVPACMTGTLPNGLKMAMLVHENKLPLVTTAEESNYKVRFGNRYFYLPEDLGYNSKYFVYDDSFYVVDVLGKIAMEGFYQDNKILVINYSDLSYICIDTKGGNILYKGELENANSIKTIEYPGLNNLCIDVNDGKLYNKDQVEKKKSMTYDSCMKKYMEYDYRLKNYITNSKRIDYNYSESNQLHHENNLEVDNSNLDTTGLYTEKVAYTVPFVIFPYQFFIGGNINAKEFCTYKKEEDGSYTLLKRKNTYTI